MAILAHCRQFNILINSVWIPTAEMAADGADAMSRMDYSKLFRPLTVSAAGVEFIRTHYGQPDANLFAVFDDNVFDSPYCSHHWHEGDEKFLGTDGISFLTTRPVLGLIFLLPPTVLIEPVVKILQDLKIQEETTLLLIIPDFLASTVRQCLFPSFKIVQRRFSSRRSKGLLSKKTHHAYVLFVITKA